MNMESILCIYKASVLVIAVDLCRVSPVKCADRDKNDWQYKFQTRGTAERTHLQRCRKDRRARYRLPFSLCVSLIKTNERTRARELVNFMQVARIGPACMAFPLPARSPPSRADWSSVSQNDHVPIPRHHGIVKYRRFSSFERGADLIRATASI